MTINRKLDLLSEKIQPLQFILKKKILTERYLQLIDGWITYDPLVKMKQNMHNWLFKLLKSCLKKLRQKMNTYTYLIKPTWS